MKVFIGWSGDTSHKVALALRDWLPKVIQALKPFVSSEDIAKGGRWSPTIAGELQASFYGIISVTRENSNSAWINFEAGALSREIEKSLVTPFLFGLKPSDIQGPLSQFQSVLNAEEDIFKMISSINEKQQEAQRLDRGDLKIAFDVWWPRLRDKLKGIEHDEAYKTVAPKRETEEVLEELVNSIRTQRFELSDVLNTIGNTVQISFQDQQNRTAQLIGLVGALARSVESLHTEVSKPIERQTYNLNTLLGDAPPPPPFGVDPSTPRSANVLADRVRGQVMPHRKRQRDGSNSEPTAEKKDGRL